MNRPSTLSTPSDARSIVDELLEQALQRGASDLHIEPTATAYEVRMRIDGLLESVNNFDSTIGRSITTRLMVMAQLLTYRQDIPQEGRFTVNLQSGAASIDLRLAIMPTTHGLRAAVRLPADLLQSRTLDQLQLPAHVVTDLKTFAAGDSGMLIITGPAGSGKTTTIYALLRYLVQHAPGQSIISLEDPVEQDLAGVTQIEVSPFGQLTYERAVRSILRQDPQVLMLGEIRDATTATLAIQAALSGHRLICTFHASTAAGAIARLIEMGIEPYQITSSVYGIVCQRLLRKKTPTGYRGRIPIATFAKLDDAARLAILNRDANQTLDSIFNNRPGCPTLRQTAADLVTTNTTDLAEVQRVLGPVSL